MKSMTFKPLTLRSLSPWLAVLLLAAMAVARVQRHADTHNHAYHAQVAEAIQSTPQRIGDWVGEDQPVPTAAVDLLQPNVILCRRYRNEADGQAATVLLVHCRDTNDLDGHYPPICYPSHGWGRMYERRRSWQVGSRTIEGTEYGFRFGDVSQPRRISIANVMVLPNGELSPDMSAVRKLASHPTLHSLGAAQIQIITDARLPSHERDRIVEELMAGLTGAIDVIGQGVTP